MLAQESSGKKFFISGQFIYLQLGNLTSVLTQNVVQNQNKIFMKYRCSCPSVQTVFKAEG